LPAIEFVGLDDASGRVLARAVVAGDDHPAAARSLMDGFALCARETPGEFEIAGEVAMGSPPPARLEPRKAVRIPTGGLLPPGADAVVPVEDVAAGESSIRVGDAIAPGDNVSERGADMRRGETILSAPRRIRAAEIGVLATLGVVRVPVYRRPIVAVLSSGDELVAPAAQLHPGQIRDSNRYAVAASLRAMGCEPHHGGTLRDDATEFESALRAAISECDAVVVTGGSSIGERDRLPRAVAAVASPGILVHGLRVKPGKPTLLAADGAKPIVGLPGNPTSALMMLEAVAAPIFGALTGVPIVASQVAARLAEPALSRAGWTWYIPVVLRDEGGPTLAYPLALRSFSVSLTSRADGYIVMEERDETWAAGTRVTVHRFFGS
jgi:molybdenum cofactor synthesis domain-containing protein